VFDALGWRMAERVDCCPVDGLIDMAYRIVENSHPDYGGLELNVCDFERCDREIRVQAASSRA
jgi:single-stranded-DNA-specific exonuclease